jgi:hypothetical protein
VFQQRVAVDNLPWKSIELTKKPSNQIAHRVNRLLTSCSFETILKTYWTSSVSSHGEVTGLSDTVSSREPLSGTANRWRTTNSHSSNCSVLSGAGRQTPRVLTTGSSSQSTPKPRTMPSNGAITSTAISHALGRNTRTGNTTVPLFAMARSTVLPTSMN